MFCGVSVFIVRQIGLDELRRYLIISDFVTCGYVLCGVGCTRSSELAIFGVWTNIFLLYWSVWDFCEDCLWFHCASLIYEG